MSGVVILARGDLDPALLAPALSLYLLALFLLVGLFLLATFVLARTMRRVHQDIWRRAATPTAAEDVWAMHRLPAGETGLPGELDDRRP